MPPDAPAPRLLAGLNDATASRDVELAIHVLAQLGDDASLRATANAIDRTPLERLATAYGIEARVRFAVPPVPQEGEALVDTALRSNTRTAVAELVQSFDCSPSWHVPPRGDDRLLAGERIVFVTNRPAHYRVALLNRLHERLAAVDARLSVLFTAATPWSRPWMRPEHMHFAHRFLRSVRVGLPTDVPIDLESGLRAASPTSVLVGTFSPLVAGRAALFCAARSCSLGVVSGEIPWHGTAAGRLRRLQRIALLRRTSFAISYGHASAEYLRDLAPRLPLVYGRNTAPIPEDASAASHDRDRVEILAVGQAISRKGLDIAIDAMAQLGDLPCRLTVIGAGDALADLRTRAAGSTNVRLLGAVPSDQILDAYREADVFLFPTRSDVFGLVLVEAMGAGLAVIASRSPGAIADLAVPGVTCLLAEDEAPSTWARAIRRLVTDPAERARLGAEARRSILRRWTLEHEADAWMAGLRLSVLTR